MRAALRQLVRRSPALGRALGKLPLAGGARDAAEYWERRYAKGGDSGAGSYGALAEHKAEFLNGFVRKHAIQRVLEFGCGDGNQLGLAEYPSYVGLDVSGSAVARCANHFAADPSKAFFHYDPIAFHDTLGLFHSELCLSLDVLYHLVEDETFELHMTHLFASATRFVIIFSSDFDQPISAHVRNRHFTPWVEQQAPDWELQARIANPHSKAQVGAAGSDAEFFVFARKSRDEPNA